MKKSIFLSLFLFLFLLLSFTIVPISTRAQVYNTAIGARLGYPLSVSVKQFLGNSSAIEVYAGTRGYSTYRWYHVSGAYQIHKPVGELENLQYYFGAGATAFFWSYDFFDVSGLSTTTLGAQGYLGLDFTFNGTPINLTLDWIPTIYIGDAFLTGFSGSFGSLGVRYVLR